MAVRWYSVVVDCADVAGLSRWWAQALDWTVTYEARDEVVIKPRWAADKDPQLALDERVPELVFGTSAEAKQVKNRLHLDLAPGPDDDQAAEVERLVGLGARRIDIGQGDDVGWVVLADPEGNEFCVLTSRDR